MSDLEKWLTFPDILVVHREAMHKMIQNDTRFSASMHVMGVSLSDFERKMGQWDTLWL